MKGTKTRMLKLHALQSANAVRRIADLERGLLALAALVLIGCLPGEVLALGSIPVKDLPSISLLERLHPEVRRSAERVIRSCDGKVGTTSEFARFLKNDRADLITLHFHSSNCLGVSAVCDSRGCLHQIYVSHGRGYGWPSAGRRWK
jgi:hypothetical protein